MDVLKEKRRLKRTFITKTINFINLNIIHFTPQIKYQNLTKLQSLQAELKSLDDKIFELLFAENNAENAHEKEFESCSKYETDILHAIADLQAPINEPLSAALARPTDPAQANLTKLKLPQIPLPEYSNKEGEDIQRFFINFEQIINKYPLTPYEKYVYLKRQLSGDPLVIIKSLETVNQDYDSAKKLLLDAFAITVTQQFTAIKRLSELNFSVGEDPYEFISNTRLIVESFKTLKIDSDIVLQYFIWTAMNSRMQDQLIHITNENKPALKDIMRHIFTATDRYKNSMDRVSNNVNSPVTEHSISAASVKHKSTIKPATGVEKYCSLCSDDKVKVTSHYSSQCEFYGTPKSKCDRLMSIGGCVKCGNRQHTADKCRHKFKKRCYHCKQFHFSYLCNVDKNATENKDKKKKDKKSPEADKAVTSNTAVQSGSVFVGQVTPVHYGEDAVIPTFSIRLPDNSVIRGMRDSGCQPNFITEEAASRLKLKTLKNDLQIAVNGFIATENRKTTIVSLQLDESSSPIQAICVPSIRTKLRLPDLDKVVTGFLSKGYELADEFLADSHNEISNLDFVLGNNDAQILLQQEVAFGEDPKSVYIKTPVGIMLCGGVNRMLNNLPYLPNYGPEKTPTKKNVTEPLLCTVKNEESSQSTDIENLFSMEVVIDTSDMVSSSDLNKAAREIQDMYKYQNMEYDSGHYSDESKESDERLANFVLENTTRTEDGRLTMPLLWNENVHHLLGNNIRLSESILRSNAKRLQKNPDKLLMYDQVIKSHVDDGILHPIDNLPQYLKEHPNVSFLPHMGVFKMERESTKCRVVLLSNLTEKTSSQIKVISHNQAIASGPNLNRKISTAITKLRFDKHLLCFDIKKAFLNINLRSIDRDKLLIHWFKNISKEDFTIIAYQYARLPFGLRCSPAILMLGMYKILMLDTESDTEEIKQIKRLIYDLIYVDNGALTTNDEHYLYTAFKMLDKIFNPYNFFLQQYTTNSNELQQEMDRSSNIETPQVVKLLGLKFDRISDTISTDPIRLDPTAGTKRMVLSTIASNYDVLQLNGPLLNRARLFMHKLQCNADSSWDDQIPKENLKEWKNICRQVNNTPSIVVNRHIGDRNSEYKLIAFTDSSKNMLGSVIYIQDMTTRKVSFLQAKNRIITKQLATKSIPCLELHAISLGVQTLFECFRELTGDTSVVPIKIVALSLYSDSMVALCWLNSFVNKLDKMRTRTPFVMNRLEAICRLTEKFPVNFHFSEGKNNPSDYTTRAISYKQLQNTCYVSGPSFLETEEEVENDSDISFRVPNRWAVAKPTTIEASSAGATRTYLPERVIPVCKYSSFHRHVRILRMVLKFIRIMKKKLANRDSIKYAKFAEENNENLFLTAKRRAVISDQQECFPELTRFFDQKKTNLKDAPNLVLQLNTFRDSNGIMRVRSKFKKWSENSDNLFPILLSKSSQLTELIVKDVHLRFAHAGIYSVLAELRKQYYIPQVFSVVKKILKQCVTCRKVNERTIKLNQSYYRDFRCEPPTVPFRYVFIDHFGPYNIIQQDITKKVWILCVTCLWSRAINLKICYDLSVSEFLRTFQLHIFDFGIPEKVLSDLGSQIIAGSNLITNWLKDSATQAFFGDNHMKPITFEQYFKGCSALGGLVESCVKLCKRLIHAAIGKNLLSHNEFELVIAQTVHLVNKRPVAFKESLRDDGADMNELPEPITPELLLRGYDLPSLNIVPERRDDEWLPSSSNNHETLNLASRNLQVVRERLKEAYHGEFLGNLIHQASNKQNRYKPVLNKKVKVGDVVLLKENNLKSINYPMGIVKEVIINELDEVTNVIVRKGSTRENVKRHITSVIPLLSFDTQSLPPPIDPPPSDSAACSRRQPQRQAAIDSQTRTRQILQNNSD